MKLVEIFTDTTCLRDTIGGLGILLRYKNIEKRISRGYHLTTNSRMEILSIIEALSQLKEPCYVKIYCDSEYIQNGITCWLPKWKNNQWRGKSSRHSDLWIRLDQLLQQHSIEWLWLPPHSYLPELRIAYKLAREGAALPTYDDIGFIG